VNLSAKKILLYRVALPTPDNAGTVLNVLILGVSKIVYVEDVVVVFAAPAAI
jgi:hypothetical protein